MKSRPHSFLSTGNGSFFSSDGLIAPPNNFIRRSLRALIKGEKRPGGGIFPRNNWWLIPRRSPTSIFLSETCKRETFPIERMQLTQELIRLPAAPETNDWPRKSIRCSFVSFLSKSCRGPTILPDDLSPSNKSRTPRHILFRPGSGF